MKPCLCFRVTLGQVNEMVDLSKNENWQKTKTPPEGQTSNMGVDKAIKICKVVESHTIPIGIDGNHPFFVTTESG